MLTVSHQLQRNYCDKWGDSLERNTDGSLTEGRGPWRAWQQSTTVYQFPTRRNGIHCPYIWISPQIGHCLSSNETCAFPSKETHHMTWEFRYWVLELNCQGLASTLPLVLCVTWTGHLQPFCSPSEGWKQQEQWLARIVMITKLIYKHKIQHPALSDSSLSLEFMSPKTHLNSSHHFLSMCTNLVQTLTGKG